MLYRIAKKENTVLESGLKLFLSKRDLERMYDFEEECMEGYNRKNDAQIDTLDETINLSKKIEVLGNCFARLERRTHEQSLVKLEQLCEQTTNHLAVIHRFMARHTEALDEKQDGPEEGLRKLQLNELLEKETLTKRDIEDTLTTSREARKMKSPSPFEKSTKTSPTRKFDGFERKAIQLGTCSLSKQDNSEPGRHMNIGSTEHSIHSGLSGEICDSYADKLDLVGEMEPDFGEVEHCKKGIRLQQQTSCHTENTSHSSCKHDPNMIRMPSKHVVKTREYTSITDHLEVLVPNSWNIRKQENTIPAVQVEADMLKDAEDDDYNLFETVIERRLRRDSTNFHSSMEELMIKSIREVSSSDESRPESPQHLTIRQNILKRVQSRIRTRKSAAKRNISKSSATKPSSHNSNPNADLVNMTKESPENRKINESTKSKELSFSKSTQNLSTNDDKLRHTSC